jgi:nucleotide-binding universal stress UspA family protein
MIKRILLGVGGTPYTHVAIQCAVSLAKRFVYLIRGFGKFVTALKKCGKT